MPKIIHEKELQSLLGRLIKEYKFIGPVKKDVETSFSEIRDQSELIKNYINTIAPPKYLFLLPEETLFIYKMNKDVVVTDKEDNKKTMIFGVRPCDVHGIRMMNKVFRENFDDPYYLEKRKATIIFAVTCTEVSSFCFCKSWGTGPSLTGGFDLLLTDLGDRYIFETGSKIGNEIIEDLKLKEATASDLKNKEAVIKVTEAKFTRKFNIDNIQEIMESKPDHPTWKEEADRCLSCGNCTNVCPTCYCFDVNERIDYDPSNAERWRLWDSCTLLEYSQVALGGNFRKERITRLKQFMRHKLSSSKPQYGDFHCVGCGRCIKWCPIDIDLTKVANDLRGE